VTDVSRLYGAPPDTLIWHDGSQLSRAGFAAIDELRAAGEYGLEPGDYDAMLLDTLARRPSKGVSAFSHACFILDVPSFRGAANRSGSSAADQCRALTDL
jgi:hypothetical protein